MRVGGEVIPGVGGNSHTPQRVQGHRQQVLELLLSTLERQVKTLTAPTPSSDREPVLATPAWSGLAPPCSDSRRGSCFHSPSAARPARECSELGLLRARDAFVLACF